MSLKSLHLHQFKLLVENAPKFQLVAQEQPKSGYSVLAIDTINRLAFTVRHHREDKPRTWRLDRLMLMLKSVGVNHCEVRNYEPPA